MTAVAIPNIEKGEQRFRLSGVTCNGYEAILRSMADRHVFVTYDRGELEIMSSSWEHERRTVHLAMLARLFAKEAKIRLVSGGSTTFRRQELARGLEPDRCFYVQHVQAILGKRKLDLSIDPPPDLAIEVEISQRLLDRVSIYEALRVPELWRCRAKGPVRVFVLGKGGKYVQRDSSPTFPKFPLDRIDELLDRIWDMDEAAWEAWARDWRRVNVFGRKLRRRGAS